MLKSSRLYFRIYRGAYANQIPLLHMFSSTSNEAETKSLSTLNSALPSNLKLADIKVFDPPAPALIKNVEFYFPLKGKDVPKTIQVLKFNSPGDNSHPEVPIDPKIFGVAIRKDIVAQVIRYQRAKIRQPQKTKRVGEVSGSGRKLYQQKGTGRARAHYSRASTRRGGGKAHGPVLRDFSFSLNRKLRAMAMMIAIAAKHREGNLVVFDNFNCEVRIIFCSLLTKI
jgi:hypothetical protein